MVQNLLNLYFYAFLGLMAPHNSFTVMISLLDNVLLQQVYFDVFSFCDLCKMFTLKTLISGLFFGTC